MSDEQKLEQYLSRMESVLKTFPTSDRAEVILEIKSHVYSALESDPNQTMVGILNALGEPEVVANRYLMERGLKPTRPPISPIVKWLVFGFLGTLGLMLIFGSFALW